MLYGVVSKWYLIKINKILGYTNKIRKLFICSVNAHMEESLILLKFDH